MKIGTNARIREALSFGPMTAGELRVCLGLKRGQVTSALDDMCRRGAVVKESAVTPAAYALGLITTKAERDAEAIHRLFQKAHIPVFSIGNLVARV